MIVYSHEYSSAYDPSAPVAEMVIRNPVPSSPEAEITALVDSAADGTMIPINVLQAIGAEYVETRQVRGVSGFAYPVDMYFVKVGIGPHTISEEQKKWR